MPSKQLIDQLKGILIIPIALAVLLVPFSLIIGWNLITVLVFWFLLIPVVTVYLPEIVSKHGSHLLQSVIGLILFYGLMVFMIYDHYKSDYFLLMMISAMANLVFVSIISLTTKGHTASAT